MTFIRLGHRQRSAAQPNRPIARVCLHYPLVVKAPLHGYSVASAPTYDVITRFDYGSNSLTPSRPTSCPWMTTDSKSFGP